MTELFMTVNICYSLRFFKQFNTVMIIHSTDNKENAQKLTSILSDKMNI